MKKPIPQAVNIAGIESIGFMDKRLIIFILVILIGLIISASLLLSVDTTSKAREQLRDNNQLLLTTQELKIQFDRARASITTFMFLGSNNTWQDAMQEINKLTDNIQTLTTSDSQRETPQEKLVMEIASTIVDFKLALPPLKTIRQNSRGVIEGVVASNINQSEQQYLIVSSMSTAIENLSYETPPDKDLIIKIQQVQSLWLRVVMEFRSLLLLRSPRAQQSTLLFVEQFSNKWSALIKNIDSYDIGTQSDLEIADKNQQIWISKLPGVINTHMAKNWRRDLRYMQENLDPISGEILSLVNGYEVKLHNDIQSTTDKIIILEERNIIWALIVMGLVTVFSLIMLVTYKRLLATQKIQIIDAENINQMKTEFLSTISHELRTPLNAIMGFGQILELNIESTLTKQQKNNVNEINVAGKHLLHLVNEILDLSAIEAGKMNIDMQKVDLHDVLKDSISLSSAMAKKHDIHISSHTDNIDNTTKCYVSADPVRLRQAFINLISNAIKYNKKGGEVIISVKHETATTCIDIRDTGCGISQSNIKKLFQPFERLDKESDIEGAGIGLMVTKGLIKSMNGHIRVTSVLGKGSCFQVEIETA